MRFLIAGIMLILSVSIEDAVAVIDYRTVQVTEGDPVTRLANITEVTDITKVTLENPCKHGTDVLRYCSPGTEKHGCKNISSSRFSLQINGDDVTLDLVNVIRSDAGCYILAVFGNIIKIENITMSVESQPSTPTKPTDTTFNINALAVVISLTIVLLVVLGVFAIYCIFKKKPRSLQPADVMSPLQEQYACGSVKETEIIISSPTSPPS